jgi:hypothetical protein
MDVFTPRKNIASLKKELNINTPVLWRAEVCTVSPNFCIVIERQFESEGQI